MIDRRGNHRIQKGTGRARCQYCKETITSEEWDMVAPIHSKFERHHHLFSSDQCEGWIYHEWNFIKDLLWKLVEIGGDDYDEFVHCLINLWEEDPE